LCPPYSTFRKISRFNREEDHPIPLNISVPSGTLLIYH
jgi:hypothetical protein